MSYSDHDSLHHLPTYSAFHQSPPEPNSRDQFTPRQATQLPDMYAPSLIGTSGSAESTLSATTANAAQHNSGPTPLPLPFLNSQDSNGGYGGWYGQKLYFVFSFKWQRRECIEPLLNQAATLPKENH
jgi:hypothetical protein